MKNRIIKNNFHKKTGKNTPKYKSMKEIREIYFPKAIINQKIIPDSRILDIGCGEGFFLKICDEHNLKTYGLDISETAINKAKKNTRAELYVHNVDNGLELFKDNFFDIITMFDVIEHVNSPYNILKEVLRTLKPSGKHIITTPNLNSISKLWEKNNWHGYKDESHKYLFTPLSLSYLVKKAGFEVKLETPFHKLPRFIQKVVNKSKLGGEIWLICSYDS